MFVFLLFVSHFLLVAGCGVAPDQIAIVIGMLSE